MLLGKVNSVELLKKIFEKGVQNLFPQTCVALRIFISIPVSVSQGKCSISKLLKIFYDLLWAKTAYQPCNALTGVWSGKRTQLWQYYRFVCFTNSKKVKIIGTCVKHNLMQSCLYMFCLLVVSLSFVNELYVCTRTKTNTQKKPPKAPEHTLEHLSRSSIFWRSILLQGWWASVNLMYTKGAPVWVCPGSPKFSRWPWLFVSCMYTCVSTRCTRRKCHYFEQTPHY